MDFSGHGSRPMPDGSFSIELFAGDVLQFMEHEQLEQISIFGYSMGGYVAMYLAKYHSEKINRAITLGTKYYWDEAIAAKEIQLLNPDKIEQKLPAFAATLKQRHTPNDWKEVLMKTAEMMVSLGARNTLAAEDYASISIPLLLLLGDRDKMVSLEETTTVFKALPNAQMGMLPNTPHQIEQVDVEALSLIIDRFLLK